MVFFCDLTKQYILQHWKPQGIFLVSLNDLLKELEFTKNTDSFVYTYRKYYSKLFKLTKNKISTAYRYNC